MLHGNSPVESAYMLENEEEIEKAIHTQGRNHLSAKDVEAIAKLLDYTEETL